MNAADIKILLVDDDEIIRECVTAYLEDEGFTVLGTATAEDALQAIVTFCPIVCISDMRLPNMNGDEFILKAHELHPSISYMLHTGMNCTLSKELRDIGMTQDDVLLKPIHDLKKLVNKIKTIAEAGGVS